VAVTKIGVSNAEVAAVLDEVGDILEAQGAQPYRALAYHRAASTVRELPSSIADLVETGGEAALESLPGRREPRPPILEISRQRLVRTASR
jgi:DNA polymerase (family 10)